MKKQVPCVGLCLVLILSQVRVIGKDQRTGPRLY